MLGERLANWPPALERCDAGGGHGHLGSQVVLAGIGLEILELELQLIEQAVGALGARAVLLAPELGDLQLEVGDHGLDGALARHRVSGLGLGLTARASASSAR